MTLLQRFALFFCALVALKAHPSAEEPLRVVTTIPSVADLTKRLGGEHVQVHSLARGQEDLHFLPVRPSALVQMSKADLFLCVGLGLEHAFAPGLLRASRNLDIQIGTDGFHTVGKDWETIQIPPNLSRVNGTCLHPMGNPHINLSVRSGAHMAREVHAALCRKLPRKKELLDRNLATFEKEVEKARERWAKIAKPLAGKKVVQFHQEFDYWFRDVGIEVLANIEPRPGVIPSAKYLAELAQTMRDENIDVIFTAPWSNNRFCRSLAKKTGAKIVVLPHMVHAVKGVDSWFDLQDELLKRVTKALVPAERVSSR